MKCLNCGKPVKQTPGKRTKTYCDANCRQKHWLKKSKEANPSKRGPGRPKKTSVIQLDIREIDNVVTEWAGLTVVVKEPIITDNTDVLKQISAIKAEKIPSHRDTLYGRKSWAADQKKRIQELEAKLK